jgi:hypothetical protein
MLWVWLVIHSKYWAHQTIEKEASLWVGRWVGDGWVGKIILFITKSNMISPFKKQLKACEKVAFSFTHSHTPLGFHFPPLFPPPTPHPLVFAWFLRSIKHDIWIWHAYNSLESLTTTSTSYDGMKWNIHMPIEH